MEIRISSNSASSFFLEVDKISWHIYARKHFRYPALLLLLGLILLVIGILQGSDTVVSSSQFYENSKRVVTTKTFYNYHITFGLGIGFISTFLHFIYMLFRQKKRFFELSTRMCNRLKKFGDNFILRINNESIFYQDFELTKEEKWTKFSSYRIEQGYLFLFRESLYITSTAIPIKQLENNNLPELMKILHNNSIHKK
jgi:hypothetical protein